MTDVAVAIGNHNGARVLDDCLASLAAQTRRPSETFVVDASSTDSSRAIAARHGARVLEADNRGLGYLYNAAAAAAASPYLLVANNDVAFDERCLELLAAALDADGTLFAADPRQDGWHDGRLVHARTTLRRGPLLRQLLPGFRLDLTAEPGTAGPTVTANAGAMLVRRERLLELGGFDETFFLDYEDLDLCWRAWLRGWGSSYVPEARVRHRVGGSMNTQLLERRLANSHHNLVRFAFKCLPPTDAARILAVEVLRCAIHPRPVARGLTAALLEAPEILRLRRAIAPSAALVEWMVAGQPG